MLNGGVIFIMKHKFLYIIFISAFVSILTFMLNGCSSPMPQNPQEKLEQNHWYLKSDIDNQGELYFENNKMHLIFNPNQVHFIIFKI